ncbi:MAG TPA: hypothetical protein PLI12_02125, partial [Acetobacteraceae bacterium]|nr:hypothetical protein [Acetobacteraceae bacterium]
TRTTSLEGWDSTVELHPRCPKAILARHRVGKQPIAADHNMAQPAAQLWPHRRLGLTMTK